MQYLNIAYDVKNLPKLDEGFVPFGVWRKAFLDGATVPFWVAVEREDGKITVRKTFLRGPEFAEANYRYAERTVKFLLWSVGGFRVYLNGDDAVIADHIRIPAGRQTVKKGDHILLIHAVSPLG